MLTKLMLSLLTINILMKTTSTQYYANQYYQNMPQQYYQQQSEPHEMDYEDPIEHEHYRRSGHKKYGSSGGSLPREDYEYDDSDECKCSCKRCKNTMRPPKPCCREMCYNCSEMQEQPGQGGLFFVPYPYPLMVPNLIKNETTTTTTTTEKPSTKKKTSSEASGKSSKEVKNVPLPSLRSEMKNHRKTSAEIINDFILRSPRNLESDKKYMLTTIRKTKPTWEPKYGIVPIPDNLAEKLLSQLRQVRELQARRF